MAPRANGLAVFGLGTITGMMTLSIAISVPFRFSAGRLGGFHRGLEAVLGTGTGAVGSWIAIRSVL